MPRKYGESDVELLVKRLRNRGFLIPNGYVFRSFRRGRHMREAGVVSWRLTWMGKGEKREVGSRFTVREFLRNGGLWVKWLD